MGLNIIAYRITGISEELDWNNRILKCLEVEKYKDFDYSRYSGDREFVINNKFIPHPEDGQDFQERFYRPENIELCKQYVKENIFEGNQPRLLKLLEQMELDTTIYLYFSW